MEPKWIDTRKQTEIDEIRQETRRKELLDELGVLQVNYYRPVSEDQQQLCGGV